MKKEIFMKMKPNERVKEINKLLQKHELKEVASMMDIPFSTFCKEMRKGDFFYSQSDRKYFHFIRDENHQRNKNIEYDEINFISENIEVLKELIENFKGSLSQMVISEKIYNNASTYVMKTFKLNNDVYEDFYNLCHQKYPHIRIQDLTGQALHEFTTKYSK
jgi:bifunctional pyridoxal-dependent enzyme with beta-cystathionase and maltose regulon repressor activities